MATFKSNMAQAADDMLDLPANLEGILQEVNGQKEVKASAPVNNELEGEKEAPSPAEEKKQTVKPRKERKTVKARVEGPVTLKGDDLWSQFVSLCEDEQQVTMEVGRNGTAGMVRVEKDLLQALRMCPVNDHSLTTMINSILRAFFLHYKGQFLVYRAKKNPLL